MLSPYIEDNYTFRLLSLIFSCIICLHCGTLYSFGSFIPSLEILLSRSHIAIIGSCGDCGYFLSLIIGFFYSKYGTKATLILSTFLFSFSYYLSYESLRSGFSSVALLSFLFFLIGLGSGGLLLTAISVNSQNFNISHRGAIIGGLLTCYAASAIFANLIYSYEFNFDVEKFFAFLSISSLICGFLALLFVGARVYEQKPEDDPKNSTLPEKWNLPLEEELNPENFKSSADKNTSEVVEVQIEIEKDPTHTKFYNWFINWKILGVPVPEHSFKNVEISARLVVFQPLFWFMFWTEFIAYGLALMWKNSIGSLGVGSATTSVLVTIWVTANAFTRLFTGFGSDYFILRLQRPAWVFLGTCVFFISQFIFICSPSLSTVWVMTFGTAIGYGSVATSTNQLVSILFGAKSYGLNNGLIHVAGAAGGLFFTWSIGEIASATTAVNTLSTFQFGILFSFFLTFIPLILTQMIIYRYPPSWVLKGASEGQTSEYLPMDKLPVNQ